MHDRLEWTAQERALCRAITFGRQSSFVELGRQLDPAGQDLFAVTYASMRVADDFVDEIYLKRSLERKSIDPSFVRDWLQQYFDAVAGESTSDRFDHPLIRAARKGVRALGLGGHPWRELQRSLARDVERNPPADWEQFGTYAEGACVAPAVIYLAIAEAGSGRDYGELAEDVRDLALFCYLVHLARDLHADLRVDRQVSCVPLTVLPRAPRPAEFDVAKRKLLVRAAEHGARSRAHLEVYAQRGSRQATAALQRTLAAYRAQAQILAAGQSLGLAG